MAVLKKRAGYYTLYWQDAQGRHAKSLGKVGILPEQNAKAILKAKEYELSTGAQLLRVDKPASPSLGEFAPEYLEWHRGEYPTSHYRVKQILEHHFLPRWEFTPLDRIAIEDINEYKKERRLLVRSATLGKELRQLQAVMNHAVLMGKLARNQIARASVPQILDAKPHVFYEAEDLARLYAKAEAMHAPIWKLLANTGLRRGEALALRWGWVEPDSIKILSTEEERTKSGKWRQIPLSDGAREALAALRLASGGARANDRVLLSICPPSLSRAFARDAKAAKIGGSLHTLRHTYISHLVRAGVAPRTVQLYAGHAHLTTTEKYLYLAPGVTPSQALRLAI